MTLSIRELKEYLIAKEGYTISPNHSQLADLKALVDNMMGVRNGAPPSTGSGYYSGTTCNGHQVVSDYSLSLGDINDLDIRGCSCHTVKDATAYCRSRTYSCSCNSNTPVCDCDDRIGSCSCNSNTPVCDCNLRTAICDCEDRLGLPLCRELAPSCTCVSRDGSTYLESCTCNDRTSVCDCESRGEPDCRCNMDGAMDCECVSRTYINACICDNRTATCDCEVRTSSCGTVSPAECTCEVRTSSCGSRSTTSCTCNGRCACNTEKRFA